MTPDLVDSGTAQRMTGITSRSTFWRVAAKYGWKRYTFLDKTISFERREVEATIRLVGMREPADSARLADGRRRHNRLARMAEARA